jgi:dTDP-4-dehydrorhamnose reductase
VLEALPEALVIRTNFFGWGPSYRRTFMEFIIEALRSGKSVTLFEDVFYTPILVEAAASAVHDLVERGASGIFHVVGDERVSKYGFGLEIARQFNLDSSLIASGSLLDQPGLVQRPRDMSLSNHKVCKKLSRKLGDVAEHVARLRGQESDGLAQEIRRI